MPNTQLILFPQTHDGTFSSTAISHISQYVANHAFTNAIFSPVLSASITVSYLDLYATLHTVNGFSAVPLLAGNWTALHTNTLSAPTQTGGQITLNTGFSLQQMSMIAQKIPNLTAGNDYDLTIDIASVPTGTFLIEVITADPSVNNGYFQTFVNNTIQSAGTYSLLITAFTNELDLIINVFGTTPSTLVLNKVEIKEALGFTPVTFEDLEDGQVICDLYDDEDIPVTLSMDEFKNTIEQTKSYSKDFMLPGTKRNNRIFNEIFDITRSSQDDTFTFNSTIFNPYVKTKAVLKNDGYTIFDGFLQLNDVVEKDDEVMYNVNLYSNTLSLKDRLANNTIADLDFTELDHDYNKDTIVASWTGTLPLSSPLPSGTFAGAVGSSRTNVLKYPFCDWTGSLFANNNELQLQNLEQAYRPWLKVRYIVDKIFALTDFTFSSNFFDDADFKKLYMDFNWGEGVFSIDSQGEDFVKNENSQNFIGESFQTYNFDTQTSPSLTYFNLSNDRFTSTVANLSVNVNYGISVLNTSIFRTKIIMRIVHRDSSNNIISVLVKKDRNLIGTTSINNNKTFRGTLNVIMGIGDYLQVEVKTDDSGRIREHQGISDGIRFRYSTTGTTLQNYLIKKRGSTKLFDILNDLRKMFNLVFIEDKEDKNNIIIEPYDKVFKDTADTTTISVNSLDWTEKLDTREYKLKPLENLDLTTTFSYKRDESDHPLKIYENFTSYYYGSSVRTYSDYNRLENKKEIKLDVFAPTVMKPVLDVVDEEFTIPAIFSKKDEEEFSDFSNEARILYDVGVKALPTTTYTSPVQNNTSQFNQQNTYLSFSHTEEIPATVDTVDYNFESKALFPSMGLTPVNNLFNTYWSNYIDELYHPDTRIVTVKLNLNPSDIQNFNFFDKVFIKNRNFRVNRIEYKEDELSTVELILLP